MPHMVYFVQATLSKMIKIGLTSEKSLASRLGALQIGCPEELKLLKLIDTHTEGQVHKKFAHLRVRGEWFKPNQELLDFIRYSPGLLDTANPLGERKCSWCRRKFLPSRKTQVHCSSLCRLKSYQKLNESDKPMKEKIDKQAVLFTEDELLE